MTVSVDRAAQAADDRKYRNIGVGCFTALAGGMGGGMIAVLLSKVWTQFRGLPQCEGIPTCDWAQWAGIGVLAGMVTLPTVSLWRLKRGDAQRDQSHTS
jgi:hypothetical protein